MSVFYLGVSFVYLGLTFFHLKLTFGIGFGPELTPRISTIYASYYCSTILLFRLSHTHSTQKLSIAMCFRPFFMHLKKAIFLSLVWI